MNPQTFEHRIDGRDRICYVDEAWLRFAREFIGPEVTEADFLDTCLWDTMVDERVQEVFRMILRRVRTANVPVEFCYRCDSPGTRRWMRLEVRHLGRGEARFLNWVEREEARPVPPLMDRDAPRTEVFLTVCSWCEKVRLPDGRWVEVEEAVEALDLFGAAPMPQLTHGMCDACYRRVIDGLSSDENRDP